MSVILVCGVVKSVCGFLCMKCVCKVVSKVRSDRLRRSDDLIWICVCFFLMNVVLSFVGCLVWIMF